MADLIEHIDALKRDPGSSEAADAVRLTARETGDFAAYAEAFVERGAALANSGDVDAAIESYVESALVFEEEVDDLEGAAKAYQAVLALRPNHRRALFALGLVLHDLRRWEELIALYRRRLESSENGGERTTLHLYVAELLSERIGDDNAAFTEVLRAARLTPTNIRIISRLELLGDRTNRLDEVAVAIGDLIMHQEDPRVRAALSLRLAEMHLGPLGDDKRALAYLRAALADDGGNPEILKEIEDVFRERKRFDALAELLEESARDRRIGPHRVRLERELARIYELELDDLPRALAALTRAARHAPDDRELLDEVMRLGLMSGDLGSVADTYEEVSNATNNALLQTYMRLKLGHIYANVLERHDDAVRVYWSILDVDPAHQETRRRLMQLHERRGETEAIVRLLELGTEGDGALEALVRIVKLCDEDLDDSARAMKACRRIVEIDPHHPLASRVPVERPAESTSSPLDLDAVGVSAVATDATEAPTEFNGHGFGPESETHFTDEVSPLRTPRRVPTTDDLVLEQTPARPAPTSEGVRLMTPDEPAVDGEPSWSAAVLEPTPMPKRSPPPPPPRGVSAFGDPSEPITPSQVGPPPPPPDDSSFDSVSDAFADVVLDPIIGTASKMGPPPLPDDDIAVEIEDIEALLAARPTPPPPPPAEGHELGEAASFLDADLDDWDSPDQNAAPSAPEDWNEAPPIRVVLGVAEVDPPEPPPVPRREAAVVTQEIRDRQRAVEPAPIVPAPIVPAPIEPVPTGVLDGETNEVSDAIIEAGSIAEVFEEIEEIEVLDPIEAVEAVEGIEAIEEHPKENDPVAAVNGIADRLAEIQKELAEATEQDDRPKMIELLDEIVTTNIGLEQTERAFLSMVRLAQLDSTMARIDQTIRLGREARAYPLLISTVEGLLGELPADQKIKVELKLAEIEHDDLQDLTRALARFERLAETAPDDEAVLGRHLSILDAAGRHRELADVLIARAEATEETKDQRGFILRAVAVFEAKLDDPRRAADLLIDFLKEGPNDEEIMTMAVGLLERTQRWADLVALYETCAGREEGEALSLLRLEIAKLHQTKLDDPAAAEAVLRRGLEERARDPQLLEALEQSLLERSLWGDFVDVGLRRLDVLHSVATKNALRKRIASVAEEHLASPDLALDVLSGAITDDPKDLDALAEIERLRRQREDWDGVLSVLALRTEAAESIDDKVAAQIAAAQIRFDIYADVEAAGEELRAALEAAPGNAAVLAALADVTERGGDYERAIDVLRQLAEGSTDRQRGAIHVRIGRMIEEHAKDREAAHEEFQAAYDADPTCVDAILALLDFAEAEEDFIRAHELAAQGAELAKDDRSRATLWCRAGRLAQDRVGDDLRALEYYEHALEADSDDLATEATVGELLLERGELERAFPHLDKAARGLSDPERSSVLHLGAARAADQLAREAAARSSYQAVLSFDPTSKEALDRLGALLVVEGDWERIYEYGASLILHHEAGLSPAERAPVYLRMARAKHGLEDFEAAARLAKKSHQLAEREVEPLRMYGEMLEQIGDVFEAAECFKRLSGLVESANEKKEALVRAGRLLGEDEGDLARASAMLTEAQTYGPNDMTIAETLSSYRTSLGDSSGAAEALVVVAHEGEGRDRADLLVRAARILIANGADRARARELLLEALEIVPTHAAARADAVVVLEFDGDVGELVRIEVRAADKFIDDEQTTEDAIDSDRFTTAYNAYRGVVDLLRHRLESPEKALGLCRKMMAIGTPTDEVREIYARLVDEVAAKGGSSATTLSREAIAAWALLLEDRPGWVEALERLVILRRRVGDDAQATLTEEILAALGEKVPPDAASNGAPKRDNSLDTRVINALRPVEIPLVSDEKSELTELFTALAYAPLRAFLDVLPEPRPKKRDLAGAAGLGIHVSRPIAYTARVLGQDSPPVYVREDAPTAIGVSFVNDQPALLVSLTKAEQHSIDELRFLMGRTFAFLRPRALALALVPTPVLREGLVGLAKIADPSIHHVDPKAAKRRGRALEKAIPVAERASVQAMVAAWLERGEGRRTLGEERAAILRTSERYGLVVSGSLSTSIQVLTSHSGGRVDRGWHAPLMRYATTRQYAEMLRRLR